MPDEMRARLATLLGETEHPYPDMRALLSVFTNMGQIQFGTYTGTAALITKTTSGNPRLVYLVDDTQTTHALNFTGMADDSYRNIQTGAVVVADGIILGTNQFSIGVDVGINQAADVGFWFAII